MINRVTFRTKAAAEKEAKRLRKKFKAAEVRYHKGLKVYVVYTYHIRR